jgi:hypothetical protein
MVELCTEDKLIELERLDISPCDLLEKPEYA